MAVRYLQSLKLIFLLIFSLELINPFFLVGDKSFAAKLDSQLSFSETDSSWWVLVSILCEEAGGEEEREGKEHKVSAIFSEINFVFVLKCLTQVENNSQLQADNSFIHSGTELLSFIRAYRI
jgi:hypothetical protein